MPSRDAIVRMCSMRHAAARSYLPNDPAGPPASERGVFPRSLHDSPIHIPRSAKIVSFTLLLQGNKRESQPEALHVRL